MKIRLLVVVLSAALLGVSSLGFACKSGGGAMTAEEYFKALQALNDEAEQRSDDVGAAQDERLGENASEEEAVAVVRESLDDLVPIFDDFLSGFRDLKPPAELQAAHDDAVSAAEDMVEAFTEATEGLGSDATMADFQALVATLESGTGQRFTDACFVLQDEADQREIAVDLKCEDEEG